MITKAEKLYGKTVRRFMRIINPVKKIIISTQCMTHKYINNKALELLKNQGYVRQYKCYSIYIDSINDGVVWADQDFKSTNHFYHLTEKRGLYGFSNLLDECRYYHTLSFRYLEHGDVAMSMFYLGAACHLIQDATVPHHVNNRLLRSHRKFELFIIKNVALGHSFETKQNIKRYDNLEDYIENNALLANSAYLKFRNIQNRDERYMKVASMIIQEAQITTAGFMLDFYEKLRDKIDC
ncbi:zinc dependent phospholipase C family protein [Clostridium sp.]|jgi:phospholipase C|uniref:zinc dependent phospholipase C family protein n=1 Tax=Clostridium sp. TaxID=1506 RepID=UPI0039F4724D